MQVDRGHLRVRNFDSLRISPAIQLTSDTQARLRPSGANEADDRRQVDQRPAAPVHGDVGKKPMLDFIPFTGSRREVADGDCLARRVGELLQLQFP